jgi:hypothetical protein
VVAIGVLWWAFIGFGSSNSNSAVNRRRDNSAAIPPSPGARSTNPGGVQAPAEVKSDILAQLEPIVFQSPQIAVPEPRRNIFVYYEKPPPPPASVNTPTPTPTPTPPVMAVAVAPSNVYARTADFTLDVTGDKFSSELKIYVDGHELPTKFVGPQQLSAVVPSAVIAAPGQRQVVVRSPDGRLYSNGLVFNVSPPPTPNYSYIGIIGDKHFTADIALLQDRNNKELLNVQRGDLLSGRFRVTSISEKEVILTDTNLKIKHTLAMSTESEKGFGPTSRPTPKVAAEDDEP